MTADTTMEITLPVGRVRGVRRHGWSEFRGIPYAAPPVGTRRFRSPQPHGAWSDVLDATRFGPVCPQEFDAIDAAMGADDQPQSEAGCLTLSVWRPEQAASGSGLPVMVWIHGGALSSGASSWPQYDGRAFARDGIVFVGVNYRLHALGFLDFGRFGADDGRPTTNLGLQDAELALRWVRANIAAFGGDPENITIFGESAGGAMVNGLVASPTARGLFRRAVMQSGTCVRLIEHEAAGQITRNACRLLGVAPDDRAALQAVPVRELVGLVGIPGLLEGVDTPVTFPWLFTRDPAGLDLDGLEAVDAGRADGLELILGWTADEYRLRRLTRAPDGLPEDLSPLGDLTGALLAAHARHRPELDPVELSEAVLNHQHFYAPALRIADAHARRGGSVHLYEFRWRSPCSVDGSAPAMPWRSRSSSTVRWPRPSTAPCRCPPVWWR